MIFSAGERPCARDIRTLAAKLGQFTLSIDPAAEGGEDEGWVELLANGLTYDLVGLGPHTAQPLPECEHRYGLSNDFSLESLEAVTLTPGPHLSGGSAMFPVVRCLALLAAQLAELEQVRAIAWHPARTLNAPDHFRRGVLSWIEGGAFPGLGLTALTTSADGSIQTEGLSLFTGQELRLSKDMSLDRAEGAKIAVRLVNWLVEHGRIEEAFTFTGPDGATLELEPVDNFAMLQVWRRSH